MEGLGKVLQNCGEIVTLDLSTRGRDGVDELPAPLGSPEAPEPKLTSAPLLPAPWGLGTRPVLPGGVALSPLSPVAGSGPRPHPALSLSFQTGGTLSSLQSLQIVPHWPSGPNTDGNSPLSFLFS